MESIFSRFTEKSMFTFRLQRIIYVTITEENIALTLKAQRLNYGNIMQKFTM